MNQPAPALPTSRRDTRGQACVKSLMGIKRRTGVTMQWFAGDALLCPHSSRCGMPLDRWPVRFGRQRTAQGSTSLISSVH